MSKRRRLGSLLQEERSFPPLSAKQHYIKGRVAQHRSYAQQQDCYRLELEQLLG